MQTQKRPDPSRVGEAQLARQASRLADDIFAGGETPPPRRAPKLRSPWQSPIGRLWDGVRKRGGSSPD